MARLTESRARQRPRKKTRSGSTTVDAYVGGRVRQRRVLLGISQEALGERVGLTFQQIQKYEKGANRIGASRLFDLAHALDIGPGWFFEGLDEDSPLPAEEQEVSGGEQDDPMSRRETLALVRATEGLPARCYRSFVALIKDLAAAQPG